MRFTILSIYALAFLSIQKKRFCVFFLRKVTDNDGMIGREIVNRIDKCLLTDNRSRKTLKIDLGISPSTISSWGLRDSSPPAESLLRIARYLNVSLEWLITGEDAEGLSPEIRALVEKIKILDQNDFKAVQQLVNVLAERYLADSALPEESSERLG